MALYRGKTVMCFLAMGLALLSFASPVQAKIDWHIQDNFRLLDNHRQRDKLYGVIARPDSFPTMFDSLPETKYDQKTKSYRAGYIHPGSWDIILSAPNAGRNQRCQWRVDTGKPESGPCHGFRQTVFRQGNSYATSVSISVKTPESDSFGSPETIVIKDKLIAVLGDSFAAGEGLPDVHCRGCSPYWIRSGAYNTDGTLQEAEEITRQPDWFDTQCHRSLFAWPVLAAVKLAREHPRTSFTLVTRACSGARTEHITHEKYAGIVNTGKLVPQLNDITSDLCADSKAGQCRKPDIVLLSIGGNDLGFSSIIKKALFQNLLGKSLSVVGVLGGVDLPKPDRLALQTKIEELGESYSCLAQELATRFPDTKVLIAGYPDPFHRNTTHFCGRRPGADNNNFLQLFSFKRRGLTGSIKQGDLLTFYDNIFVQLNKAVKKAGSTHNWQFVQMATNKPTGGNGYHQAEGFQPKGYCVKGTGRNGRWFLTANDSFRTLRTHNGTMHPNIYGHLFYLEKTYPRIEEILFPQ